MSKRAKRLAARVAAVVRVLDLREQVATHCGGEFVRGSRREPRGAVRRLGGR